IEHVQQTRLTFFHSQSRRGSLGTWRSQPFSTLAFLRRWRPPWNRAFAHNPGGALRSYSEASTTSRWLKRWTASVIKGNSADTTPTISLSFSHNAGLYVFNAGENTQRAFTAVDGANQQKRSLNLFITQIILDRVAGIGGMISSEEREFDTLNIVGPPGLSHYMASMRFQLSRDSVRATITQPSLAADLRPVPQPCFQDENISVYSIPVLPSTDTPPPATDILSLNKARELRKRMLRLMFPEPGKQKRTLDPDHPFHNRLPKLHEKYTHIWRPTVAYVVVGSRKLDLVVTTQEGETKVVEPQDSRGPPETIIDVQKADALGVPRRKLGDLQAGKNVIVTTQEGEVRVVRPKDCMGLPRSPSVMIILDIPSPSYIPSLLDSFTRSQFYSQMQSENPEYSIPSIFHLCGEGVLEDPRYVGFMNKFPSHTHHIISSPETDWDPVTFQAAALQQLKMNQLDPDMFPIPKYSLDAKKQLDEIADLPARSHPFEQGLQIGIRPVVPPAVVDPFHATASSPDDVNLSPPILQAVKRLKDQASKMDYGNEFIRLRRTRWGRRSEEYERHRRFAATTIIPLGTSGAGPNPYRNVPATLVRIPAYGSILLDCGEGTWGHLVRQFGTAGACDVLRDLKCIFISQMHINHHSGLASLLAMRKQLDPPAAQPLYLVADYKIHLSLREVSDIEDLGMDDPSGNGVVSIISEVIYVAPRNFAERDGWAAPVRSWQARQELCRTLQLLTFETIWGEDRHQSSGVVFRHKDGCSIVYAGSTVPTGVLERTCKGATVLIYDDRIDDQEEAVRNAIELGTRLNVDHLLLTHFPARHARTPPGARDVMQRKRTDKPMVSYAFDHANLTLGSMWKSNMYLPTMLQIFLQDGDRVASRLEKVGGLVDRRIPPRPRVPRVASGSRRRSRRSEISSTLRERRYQWRTV
ncbi:hypothetical protein DFH06DRAFT_129359, partial [Mycena polygramma]